MKQARRPTTTTVSKEAAMELRSIGKRIGNAVGRLYLLGACLVLGFKEGYEGATDD